VRTYSICGSLSSLRAPIVSPVRRIILGGGHRTVTAAADLEAV